MRFTSFLKTAAVLALSIQLVACAHARSSSEATNPDDPWEPMNRELFALHKVLDAHFFRPLAVTYKALIPMPVRKSVNNFFANIDEIPITLNNFFQGEFKRASDSSRRLILNTVLGVGGLFDVATEMGFERHRADFGQTLHKWGWKNSSYVFIPLFGPTTTRDGLGVVADIYMMPWPYLEDSIEWTAFGIYAVNQRAKFLDTESVLSIAALDEYSFLRDGYLANRKLFISPEETPDLDQSQEDWGDIL